MDKVTGQCPQTTTFLKRKEREAVSNRGSSAYQPNALPLGQTGSQSPPDPGCSIDQVVLVVSVMVGSPKRLDSVDDWPCSDD